MENDRKALTSNGLCIVQGANIGGDAEGKYQLVSVATRLLHTSGQWIEDTAGSVPKDFGPQAVGATLTYLRRYGYSALVGATAEGEDDDGETAEGRPPEKPAIGLLDDRRKAAIARIGALGEYLTDEEKAAIKKNTPTLSTPEVEAYAARLEKKLHKGDGAGVPDEKVLF
jgi:hypothetical protein